MIWPCKAYDECSCPAKVASYIRQLGMESAPRFTTEGRKGYSLLLVFGPRHSVLCKRRTAWMD